MATRSQSTLISTLKSIPKAQARDLANRIADLQNAGLKRIRVFPKGTPVPNMVEVNALVDKKDLAVLLPKILDRVPYEGLEVFPYGIPYPDVFNVKLDLH